jgi:hypothetical protein
VDRRQIVTDRAPAALGLYSQALVAGDLVFCSGTVGMDPATGEVMAGIEAAPSPASSGLAVGRERSVVMGPLWFERVFESRPPSPPVDRRELTTERLVEQTSSPDAALR